MEGFMKTMSVSASGLDTQSARLRVLSENIANVDTPGYHRKTLSFKTRFDAETGAEKVTVGRLRLDPTAPKKTYDPGHPLADARGYVEGSNVNLITELADAREAQRTYDANLRIFDQARRMYGGVLDLLKR